MQGFLKKIVERRLRRLAFTSTLGILAITTTAVAASRFHDSNLDLANAAVEKAQGLLALTVCGNPGDKTTEACEKEVKRAQDLLAKAHEAIAAAATAADGGL